MSRINIQAAGYPIGLSNPCDLGNLWIKAVFLSVLCALRGKKIMETFCLICHLVYVTTGLFNLGEKPT